MYAFFLTKLYFFSPVPTSYEGSSAVNVSLDAGSQQSGPYVVDHDDSTQQGSGIFGWFSGSNFMNKVVEKTKVNKKDLLRETARGILAGGGGPNKAWLGG